MKNQLCQNNREWKLYYHTNMQLVIANNVDTASKQFFMHTHGAVKKYKLYLPEILPICWGAQWAVAWAPELQ